MRITRRTSQFAGGHDGRWLRVCLAASLGLFAICAAAADDVRLEPLKVSDNGRCLVTASGRPFFWLGDTAWWIRRIPPQDVEHYLQNRAEHRFNVIQVHCGYDVEDYSGHRAFQNRDANKPNEDYWRTMDEVVDKAGEHGLYVALAPMWGEEYQKAFGDDAAKARRFGDWIGQRYAGKRNVLWIVSGEYDSINDYKLPITESQKSVLVAVAKGLREATGGTQLMTVHPGVALTSSRDFHREPWLDFNMLQSGHMIDASAHGWTETHSLVTRDYALAPTKPVLDGEPLYEDTPDAVWLVRNVNGTRAGADAVRRKAYWAVFSGACGHTYGHNNVYGFFEPAFPGQVLTLQTTPSGPGNRGHWKDALDAPGAIRMKHLRALMESRPLLERIPDQSLVAEEPRPGLEYVAATRGSDGRYALVYFPNEKPAKIALSQLAGDQVVARWFDPTTGQFRPAEGSPFPVSGDRGFAPPGPNAAGDHDWVLVLDVHS